jgi:hypothetical protein
MSYHEDSIDWQQLAEFDCYLDECVSADYKAEPLAQDWARISKVSEELGEAVAKFILLTGQNPRKGMHGSMDDVLEELADTAFTAIYAIQHFTKNDARTRQVLRDHQVKARGYMQTGKALAWQATGSIIT